MSHGLRCLLSIAAEDGQRKMVLHDAESAYYQSKAKRNKKMEAMKRALSGALRPEQYLRIALRVMAVAAQRGFAVEICRRWGRHNAGKFCISGLLVYPAAGQEAELLVRIPGRHSETRLCRARGPLLRPAAGPSGHADGRRTVLGTPTTMEDDRSTAAGRGDAGRPPQRRHPQRAAALSC